MKVKGKKTAKKSGRLTVAVVAGGDLFDRFVSDIRKADMVIGADRGALWLIERGIPPDLAIGDFDSVTEAEKRRIRKSAIVWKEFPADKDATDLELAADEAIRRKPETVRIYGALGGRFDHSVGALYVLLRLVSHNIYGEIVDNSQNIMIVRHQEKFLRDLRYRYVSVIPFGSDATVTLQGFVYNVNRKKFTTQSSLGISNEIRDRFAVITVHSGCVLVVRSKK